MPITSTRGVRNKFYNNLAKEARKLDTLALSTAITPGLSRGGSQVYTSSNARSASNGGRGEPRELGNEVDEDDGGWGSVPTSLWGESPNPSRTIDISKTPKDTYGDDGWGDRASVGQPHSQASLTTSNIPPRPHLQDQEGRTTPPAGTKVEQWISSSSPSSESKTIRTPSKDQASKQGDLSSNSQHESQGTHNTSRSGGEKEDIMNYLTADDFPSRRYGTDPTTGTNYQRTYTGSGVGDMRSPQDGNALHHTNPFLGGNLSYRGNDAEETPRMVNAALNNSRSELERTFQAKKREYEEAQRQLDEMRREKERPSSSFPLPGRPPTSFGVNRTNEHDQIIQLRQENTSLHQEISSLHSNLSQAKETINTLKNQLDESHIDPSQLENMQAEIDKLTRENSSMNELCFSLDRKLEEEKEKSRKAESEAHASRAGQSACAKSLGVAEAKGRDLEVELKDLEERERVGRERRDVLEKRKRELEVENSNLQRELESWKVKANTAYREKEGAISKYKGKENDNAKLSDKLNLSRREQDALQARLEELIEEKAQLSQQRASEKGDLADRKKLKDELHRERSTSDRLRSERNTLRTQIQKFKIQLQLAPSSGGNADGTTKAREGSIKLHHPRPTSEEKHKPRFSLSQPDETIFDSGPGDKGKKDSGVVEVEVIEDDDGMEYQPQRVSVDDAKDKDSEEVEEVLRRKTKPSDYNYSQELESILSPRLSFSSIPLVPNKLNTPISKEEVLLFSPPSSYHDGAQMKASTRMAEGEKVESVSVSEEDRKKWLDRYAGLYTDKDGKDTSSVKIENENDPSSPANTEKPKDPFADLDPLDGKLFSPKSTPRSPLTAKAKAKTLGESLMDLLGSPSSI